MSSVAVEWYIEDRKTEGGVNMANSDVREAIHKSRLHQYEIAAFMGISEYTLVRWLRRELSPEKRVEVFRAIEALKNES